MVLLRHGKTEEIIDATLTLGSVMQTWLLPPPIALTVKFTFASKNSGRLFLASATERKIMVPWVHNPQAEA